MKRDDIEAAVEQVYEARLRNEVAPCLEWFSEDATFQLAGSAAASGIALMVSDREQFRELLESLVATWHWHKVDLIAVLIDGNEAAVRYGLTATFTPTDRMITTEIMDHLVFDSQLKLVQLTQFVDTALVNQLMGRATGKG